MDIHFQLNVQFTRLFQIVTYRYWILCSLQLQRKSLWYTRKAQRCDIQKQESGISSLSKWLTISYSFDLCLRVPTCYLKYDAVCLKSIWKCLFALLRGQILERFISKRQIHRIHSLNLMLGKYFLFNNTCNGIWTWQQLKQFEISVFHIFQTFFCCRLTFLHFKHYPLIFLLQTIFLTFQTFSINISVADYPRTETQRSAVLYLTSYNVPWRVPKQVPRLSPEMFGSLWLGSGITWSSMNWMMSLKQRDAGYVNIDLMLMISFMVQEHWFWIGQISYQNTLFL